MIWSLLTACLLFLFSDSTTPVNPTIEITVTGLTNTKGAVLLGAWDQNEGFLSEGTRIFGSSLPARRNAVTFTITELPPGRYAFSVLHDADENGRMTKSLLGWPVEDYGFSNNARGTFSAPDYADCAVKISSDTTLAIAVK